jgi:hypothetical protein
MLCLLYLNNGPNGEDKCCRAEELKATVVLFLQVYGWLRTESSSWNGSNDLLFKHIVLMSAVIGLEGYDGKRITIWK